MEENRTKTNENKIEGRNAVLEAFPLRQAGRQALCTGRLSGRTGTDHHPGSQKTRYAHSVRRKGNVLSQLSETGHHQGVIVFTAAYEYSEVSDMLELARKKREDPFLILLDNIEDPHNLGAIIRTANLAGAHGVIIPKRRAVGRIATVAKTSAGALNYTPVAKVTNLKKTMEDLKKEGLWFVCADMGGRRCTI